MTAGFSYSFGHLVPQYDLKLSCKLETYAVHLAGWIVYCSSPSESSYLILTNSVVSEMCCPWELHWQKPLCSCLSETVCNHRLNTSTELVKKVRCLMEHSMKSRSLISKIGIVSDLQSANLDFDP